MTGRGRSRGGRQNTLDIPVRGHGRGSGRGRGAPTAAIFQFCAHPRTMIYVLTCEALNRHTQLFLIL